MFGAPHGLLDRGVDSFMVAVRTVSPPGGTGSGGLAEHRVDDVHTVVVEAVPALALGPLAEPLEVFRAVADDVVLAGHGEDLADVGPLRISATVSNSLGVARWVRSPVWIRKSGRSGSALILATASWSVAVTVCLYGSLPNPMWLSLIWTNEKLPAAAPARRATWPNARDEKTPPPAVQTSPVPAQAMHLRNPRRSTPSPAHSRSRTV